LNTCAAAAVNTPFVSIVAAPATRLDVARAYAISKLRWIRNQRQKLQAQARETPRQYIERESHYLWGRRHLLTVSCRAAKPCITIDHRRITLTVRPGTDQARRAALIHEWHKSLLHAEVPSLIHKWEAKLNVHVAGYFLQRMKTKWGGCNPRAGHIRLNTELVKKPKDLLEYIIVHEMLHLREPTHNTRFTALLDKHYPAWREARAELNDLPLSAQSWECGAARKTRHRPRTGPKTYVTDYRQAGRRSNQTSLGRHLPESPQPNT
jgi:predicted metal-dependent hydrolase